MYHKEVFSLKILLVFLVLQFTSSVFAKAEFDVNLLQGKWRCIQEFNLTDSVRFRSSHTSVYSLANREVETIGTITTSLVEDPETKSVLKAEFWSNFSIDGTTITYMPHTIKGSALENGLGDLTDEFVSGFEGHKVESSADIVLLSKTQLHLNYHSGTSAKCLRP